MAFSLIANNVKSSVSAISKEVVSLFPGIYAVWGYASFPDHNNKRCIDYSIVNPKLTRAEQVELGNAIARYHIENAKQFGVHGIIWNRRVMGFPHVTNPPYRGPYGEWRDYYGPKPHTDHVHVEYDGNGKANPERVSMYATGLIKGWAIHPNPRIKVTRKKGTRIVGTIKTLSDGKYLMTRFGTYYPLDTLSAKKPV
jgi:hypothetical protein